VNPLVRSKGAELGLRVSPNSQWRSTVALWALALDSELLFVGDGGTTEPTDGSGRSGITFANFFRPIAQLSLDADVSFARARLRDVAPDADHIPGALERVVAAGITWSSAGGGPFASLRVRHFGAYPLIETNAVRAAATTLVNAASGLTVGVRVQLSILNLLGTRASDIQYYYARLRANPGWCRYPLPLVEPRQCAGPVRGLDRASCRCRLLVRALLVSRVLHANARARHRHLRPRYHRRGRRPCCP
jgi:hypothetical protein